MTSNIRWFLVSLLITMVPLSSTAQDVPDRYKRLFKKYSEESNIFSDKFAPLFGLEKVGRSFALVAGVWKYRFETLQPAKADIDSVAKYLTENEYFDEVVVLENEDVNFNTLSYFFQTYFKNRLKDFPQSRFLFAYSGHGFKDGDEGFLVLSPAETLRDSTHSLNTGILAQLIGRVTGVAHHALVLVNSCHSGALLESFGSETYLPKKRGAHAITASGTDEEAFAIRRIGPGSVFFELILDAVRGAADFYPKGGDGIITKSELFTFLHNKIPQIRPGQIPRQGDLRPRGDASEGSFFFLDDDERIIKVESLNSGSVREEEIEEAGIRSMGGRSEGSVEIGYLIAEPPISVRGKSVQIKWSSKNATRCVFSDRDEIFAEAGERAVQASASSTLSIRCSNGREEASRSVDITVLEPPVIAEFEAERGIIERGESTKLRWKSRDAEECVLDNDIGSVALGGTVMVRPRTSTSYNLFCSTQDIEKRARVEIAVCGEDERVRENRCVERCPPSQLWNGTACEDECEPNEKWVDGYCEDRCDRGERWDGRRCVSKCGRNEVWDGAECVSQGLPAGSIVRPCGCWGWVNPGTQYKVLECASGWGVAVGCNLTCSAGGFQWGVRCL